MAKLVNLVVSSLLIIILSRLHLSSTTDTSPTCNDAVCASVVSKCQLLQRCSCEQEKWSSGSSSAPTNTTCLGECFKCLDYLYLECCSCVNVCSSRNDSDYQTLLGSKCHVEELPDPLPHLFSTLTEEEDDLQRWSTVVLPLQVSFMTRETGKEVPWGTGVTRVTIKGDDAIDQEEDVQANCTVAYMSDCMPINKCKSSCTSMGSSAYRWFHDGCCECVGPNCVNYGINESKCRHCPNKETNQVDNGHDISKADMEDGGEQVDRKEDKEISEDKETSEKEVKIEKVDKMSGDDNNRMIQDDGQV